GLEARFWISLRQRRHPGIWTAAGVERPQIRRLLLRVQLLMTSKSRWAAIMGLVLVAGCQRGPQPIAPAGMAPIPAATVREWVSGYQMKTPGRYDLRWTYRTQKGAAKGRASMRIAPPDSLRFDFRGPFGKSGAAAGPLA